MKIGIMGGTFNPIHQGHIEMMEAAAKAAELDYILLIPTGDPPHKVKSEVISKYDRYEMCLLAASEIDNVIVSSIEIEREGTTYTIDTLRELKSKYNDMKNLFFIIGADTILKLHSWKELGDVAKRCSFIAFGRDELNNSEIISEIENLNREFGAEIDLLDAHVMAVSSSEIRNSIQNNKQITGLVPKRVEKYIVRNNLYSR